MRDDASTPLLSVIVPAHNEEESFSQFFLSLQKSVKHVAKDSYEIIIVNDGSTDMTLKTAHALAGKDRHVKIVSLSRNFGKEIATTAGIFQAKGKATIMIDADGQHPTELIETFVRLWRDGAQVVIGVRQSNQKEGLVKHYGSKLFYRLFNAGCKDGTQLIPGATDFRLIDESVRSEFVQFTERYRITRGLIDWMGFERTTVPFHANERIGGKASYRTLSLLKLALDSFVSLSMVPLYMIGYTGLFFTVLAFCVGVFVFIEQLLLSDPLNLHVTGTAMIGILTLFLVGILLTAQGLIAIYLSHIHVQTQNRPLFIIDRKSSVNLGV